MATSLKTVCYPFPMLASIPDATLTDFQQITIYLPEGNKVFKSCWVEAMANDIITASGGTIASRRLALQLGSSGYTTRTNSNSITNSSENMALHFAADFTFVFTNSWSGSSMTCDLRVYIDQSTGTTLGFVDGTALLWITYEFDDTSSSQVKTAWIPFDSPTNGLATSKTQVDTLPAFDTFFPEASVSYKAIMFVLEGNEGIIDSTDFKISVELDTLGATESGNHETALISDRYVRHFCNWMSAGSPIFSTNSTHSLYVWISTGAVSRMNHAAMYCVVTYTFDASQTNNQNVSLLLPMSFVSPAGSNDSTKCQSAGCELWIEEPSTIVTQKSAFRLCWDHDVPTNIYFRVGSQAFQSYTVLGNTVCGGYCLQRTCDDVVSLSRGINTIKADNYITGTPSNPNLMSGVWIINYRCGKPSGGYARSNHTILWNVYTNEELSSNNSRDISAFGLSIPEQAYFINSVGILAQLMQVNSAFQALRVFVERLSGEGGMKWESIYHDYNRTDPNNGLRTTWAYSNGLFKRWIGDPESKRIDVEVGRRYRMITNTAIEVIWVVGLICTYHAITYSVSGTVSGYTGDGSGITVNIHRAGNGEKVLSGVTSAGGNYSGTWYDNTESVFAQARQDSTHVGRSDDGAGT